VKSETKAKARTGERGKGLAELKLRTRGRRDEDKATPSTRQSLTKLLFTTTVGRARVSPTSLLLYLLAMRAARRRLRVNFIHQRNFRLSNLSAAAITAAGSARHLHPHDTKGIQRRVYIYIFFFSPYTPFSFSAAFSLCFALA